MPLRVVRRADTGTLWIVGTARAAGAPKGVRVRRRAGSDDAALAREEAASLEAEILRAAWHGNRRVAAAFSVAAVSYLKHAQRSAGTRALVRRLLLHFRDTPLDQIDQAAVDRARAAMLRPNPSPATVRRNLVAPLRAILLHGQKRDMCDRVPAFDMPREPRGRTLFLRPDEFERLRDAAGKHLRPLLTFLVCTGCRIGEALALDWAEVDLQGGRALLWEGETKSGKRRVVQLPPAAVAALAGLRGRAGRVFLDHRGRPYSTGDGAGGRGQIRSAWSRACQRAGLPGAALEVKRSDRGSLARTFRPLHTPHVLRHSWASWHYALHRDLMRLRQDGGWSTVSLVERYAHLMPAGQELAIARVWGLSADTQMASRRRNARITR